MSVQEHQELHFPNQRPDEHVVLFLRRHWSVIGMDTLQLVLMLCVPPLLIAFGFIFTDIEIQPFSASYVVLVEILSIYYLLTFVIYFHDFVDYHLDVWIVTDQRVISIEQEGLFDRIVSELNLVEIQDVTSEVKGQLQTFLNFGNVYIQTAGEKGRFVFEEVAHPPEVGKVILQLHDRAHKNQNLEQIRQEVQYEQQLEQQQQKPQYGIMTQYTQYPQTPPPTQQGQTPPQAPSSNQPPGNQAPPQQQ